MSDIGPYDPETDPMIGTHFRAKDGDREIVIVAAYEASSREESPGYDYVFVDENCAKKHWISAPGLANRFESVGPGIEAAPADDGIEADGPSMGMGF